MKKGLGQKITLEEKTREVVAMRVTLSPHDTHPHSRTEFESSLRTI